jgi:hypothetical protein
MSSSATYSMMTRTGTVACIAARSNAGQSDWLRSRIMRGVTVPGTNDVTDWASFGTSFRMDVTFANIPGAGYFIAASETIETPQGPTGTFPLGPLAVLPIRTAFTPQGMTGSDNVSVTGTTSRSSATDQDLLSITRWFGPALVGTTIPFPSLLAPFTVTQNVGAPGENLFGVTVPSPSGNEVSVTARFTGSATAGAGNSYLITATREWITANGNTLAMDGKAGASYPGAAFLALPRLASAVSRTSTTITGTTIPPGATAGMATRIQVP